MAVGKSRFIDERDGEFECQLLKGRLLTGRVGEFKCQLLRGGLFTRGMEIVSGGC